MEETYISSYREIIQRDCVVIIILLEFTRDIYMCIERMLYIIYNVKHTFKAAQFSWSNIRCRNYTPTEFKLACRNLRS